jgi:hypothetical protein
MSYDCYDVETNSCDGRCQGASNCPAARKSPSSRARMRAYILASKADKRYRERIEKEMFTDPKFMEDVRELYKKT